jgi:5-methylcytosine-specific restriction endonuclease McrA
MAVGYRERLSGEANPNYRHGQSGTREWANKQSREWKRKHPEVAALRNRHAKGTLVSAREVRRLLHHQRDECAACFSRLYGRFHTDHVIPLVRGGAGHIGNIQLLCPRCNSSKKARFYADFKHRVLWRATATALIAPKRRQPQQTR